MLPSKLQTEALVNPSNAPVSAVRYNPADRPLRSSRDALQVPARPAVSEYVEQALQELRRSGRVRNNTERDTTPAQASAQPPLDKRQKKAARRAAAAAPAPQERGKPLPAESVQRAADGLTSSALLQWNLLHTPAAPSTHSSMPALVHSDDYEHAEVHRTQPAFVHRSFAQAAARHQPAAPRRTGPVAPAASVPSVPAPISNSSHTASLSAGPAPHLKDMFVRLMAWELDTIQAIKQWDQSGRDSLAVPSPLQTLSVEDMRALLKVLRLQYPHLAGTEVPPHPSGMPTPSPVSTAPPTPSAPRAPVVTAS